MGEQSAENVTLETDQIWEWEADDGEILLHDATVTIEELFVADDGTPMVTFSEPADGLYTETTSTTTQASLKRSLAKEYTVQTSATA